jgi:hypothetical protein
MTFRYIPQLSSSFYRHRAIRPDFSGCQIISDAGLLLLRAFDQREGLTHGLSRWLRDPREEEGVRHSVLSFVSVSTGGLMVTTTLTSW